MGQCTCMQSFTNNVLFDSKIFAWFNLLSFIITFYGITLCYLFSHSGKLGFNNIIIFYNQSSDITTIQIFIILFIQTPEEFGCDKMKRFLQSLIYFLELGKSCPIKSEFRWKQQFNSTCVFVGILLPKKLKINLRDSGFDLMKQ